MTESSKPAAGRRIAVAGATGMLGKPVVRQLLQAGYAVTALVRDVDAARAKLPAEVALQPVNLRDVQALAAVLRGHDDLYVSLAVATDEKPDDFHPELDGLRNLAAAARQAGIRRIGYLSSLIMNYDGFRWWVFDVKRAAAEALKASGMPYLVFYPSAFMETLSERQIQGSRLNTAGKQKGRSYWIAGEDYGRQVANAFLRVPPGESREYVVQGPEPHNTAEAARIFVQHYRPRKLKVAHAPLGLLKVIGWFVPALAYQTKIIEALNNQPEDFQAEPTWRELGKPTTTLADYAASLR